MPVYCIHVSFSQFDTQEYVVKAVCARDAEDSLLDMVDGMPTLIHLREDHVGLPFVAEVGCRATVKDLLAKRA